MAITAHTYRFTCRLKTDALLPGYLGSTLRGSLGWALKRLSCPLSRQVCKDCRLWGQCAYAWFFETEMYRDGESRSSNARPHPFILQPGVVTIGRSSPGSRFQFSLQLLDRANELLPQIVYAVKMMGRSGIGSGRKQGLGRLWLNRLSQARRCCIPTMREFCGCRSMTGG